MLKIITPADRLDMLADDIERTAFFKIECPDACFYGHCLALFGDLHPQDDEHDSDYVARLLGIDRETAIGLYYGYEPGTPRVLNRYGPIQTPAHAVRVLRELAAQMRP